MICTNDKIEKIKDWLRINLTEQRYLHSLGTMNTAGELAEMFGLDIEKAKLAGLLHDCAKCLEKETLLEILSNLPEDDMTVDLNNIKTLHAPAGAFIAKDKLGVEDKEILDSIACHTVGKTDMTDFDKIIFLADKIEPYKREKKYREKIIELLKKENGLNLAILKCYETTIKHLLKKNSSISIQTITVWNSLLTDI